MKRTPQGASAPVATPVLKCRKGDLAIVLIGPNAGLLVDVAKYCGTIEMSDGQVLINAWQVKHPSDDPDIDYFREDKYLLPIRPGDLEESELDAEKNVSPVEGESA